ncbi:MAG: hypothetical protein ACI4WM_02485 [Erysipelotrichaceae bacterium]
MNRRRILLLNIFIPLASASLIYYLFCPEVIFVKNIVFSIPSNPLFTLVRNYFMDMCWAYALTFSIFYIINNRMKTFAVSAVFSILIEVLQLTPLISGTFDIVDIIAMVQSICLSILVIDYLKKRGTL